MSTMSVAPRRPALPTAAGRSRFCKSCRASPAARPHQLPRARSAPLREAVQEVVAIAWKWFRALLARGKGRR